MTENHFYILIYFWISFGIVLFPVLLKVPAPYGRHTRKGWGPLIPNRAGWIIMELPALIIFLIFALNGEHQLSRITWIFIFLWLFHYTNRSLVYPLRTKTKNKKMPVLIVLFALIFNVMNGFLNGYYFNVIRYEYESYWLADPRFIAGFIFFMTGIYLNIRSDETLLSLRKNSTPAYNIPSGGLYRYISFPNFFGEIIEWGGFALMTWSPAALAFALWTFFNLVPRSLDHHRWYKNKFKDYPSHRKAIIPFIL
jgi:protein-S-isoprenylcysteine O-methyltransferase Ste14